ncbi:PAS domain-containing protein [Aurantiacibacter sediminis]|uniref:histidine kinase n=1 Tax=Aurantiacibacter sediminis TaxID=2793064 RepID=A0ABS0N5E6_9SPHN|nr:PAS domain-containing protein [Aurantiacibacter sediminis]MBH5323001.1 PAS domain-containing protein [Aurantiacibacter sediminis]
MSEKSQRVARAENAAEHLPAGISARTMQDLPVSLVIADAQLDDQPLIYVNSAFERMTGFNRDAIIGRNCRFLQGEDTDPETRAEIRQALDDGQEITTDIVNYRSDGEKFINRLMIVPLNDDDGNVTHFLGIQTVCPEDSSATARAAKLDESLREVQHRVKNHLAMLLALIRMEAKQTRDAKSALEVLANRVEALNLLYDEFTRTGKFEGGTIALGAYISRVCSALNMLDGKSEVRLNMQTDRLDASLDASSQVGLLVSELLTNALQHAFDEQDRGIVEVRLWQSDEKTVCLVVSDDGAGLPEGSSWPKEGNLGARIVRDLASRLNAEIAVTTSGDGTSVTLSIPARAIEPRGA